MPVIPIFSGGTLFSIPLRSTHSEATQYFSGPLVNHMECTSAKSVTTVKGYFTFFVSNRPHGSVIHLIRAEDGIRFIDFDNLFNVFAKGSLKHSQPIYSSGVNH